jgi:hypothetical protein
LVAHVNRSGFWVNLCAVCVCFVVAAGELAWYSGRVARLLERGYDMQYYTSTGGKAYSRCELVFEDGDVRDMRDMRLYSSLCNRFAEAGWMPLRLAQVSQGLAAPGVRRKGTPNHLEQPA